MRDKKDQATFELPGFGSAAPLLHPSLDTRPAPAERRARPVQRQPRQEQLPLLEETDASGLPVWRRDEHTDLTGLPVWPPAC